MAPGQSGNAAGAYRRALELGRSQLAINPKDGETMSSVALFEAHLNNRPEALRLADRSIKMEPSNNQVLFTAALTYEILGLRPAALKALRAAYEKGCSLADIEREPVLDTMHKDKAYQAWVAPLRKLAQR
jgi:tetratricopeptide (TPR) repeat protein